MINKHDIDAIFAKGKREGFLNGVMTGTIVTGLIYSALILYYFLVQNG